MEAMEALLLMGALVEVEVENRGVAVVGSGVGEAGGGVEITEDAGEDVENSISMCNFEVVSSRTYPDHAQSCLSLPLHLVVSRDAWRHIPEPNRGSNKLLMAFFDR